MLVSVEMLPLAQKTLESAYVWTCLITSGPLSKSRHVVEI